MIIPTIADFDQAFFTAEIFRNGFQQLLINFVYAVMVILGVSSYLLGRAIIQNYWKDKP